MINLSIPGHDDLHLDYLVLDYNGTLAIDGHLIAGVRTALDRLKDSVHIHVLTADTFGKAGDGLEGIDCRLSILPPGRQDVGKFEYVKQLGSGLTAAVGNGRNDCLMLAEAALGIAVVQKEGAAVETIRSADVICTDIVSALELLHHPLRLAATLRS